MARMVVPRIKYRRSRYRKNINLVSDMLISQCRLIFYLFIMHILFSKRNFFINYNKEYNINVQ